MWKNDGYHGDRFVDIIMEHQRKSCVWTSKEFSLDQRPSSMDQRKRTEIATIFCKVLQQLASKTFITATFSSYSSSLSIFCSTSLTSSILYLHLSHLHEKDQKAAHSRLLSKL